MAEVEAAARCEQQVQEQVALVVAALPIAAARAQRHQVKLGRPHRAGENAVVQADRADHLKRQVAQAADGRESHPAAGHAAARRVVEQLRQRGANHRQRQRLGHAATLHRVGHCPDRLLQLAQVVEFGVCGLHESLQASQQRAGPVRWQLGHCQLGLQALQRVDEAPESAQRER